MKTLMRLLPILLFTALLAVPLHADDEAMREAVDRAIAIFNDKQNSARPIPAEVLAHARAIGVIEITKGAFGVGGANGEGVILTRTAGDTGWSAPFLFGQGGGSVGFQIGIDIKRYIYVFNTDAAWRPFVGAERARFQAGANATAGPETAAQIAADGLRNSDLYVYTLSDGAFAGVSVGGQLVGGLAEGNRQAYGTADPDRILGGQVPFPPYAAALGNSFGAPAALRATMTPGNGS